MNSPRKRLDWLAAGLLIFIALVCGAIEPAQGGSLEGKWIGYVGRDSREHQIYRIWMSFETTRDQTERGTVIKGVVEFEPMLGDRSGEAPKIRTKASHSQSGAFSFRTVLGDYGTTISLTPDRWIKQPKRERFSGEELKLLFDPEEPAVFGALTCREPGAFLPCLAWPVGQVPDELLMIEGFAPPNTASRQAQLYRALASKGHEAIERLKKEGDGQSRRRGTTSDTSAEENLLKKSRDYYEPRIERYRAEIAELETTRPGLDGRDLERVEAKIKKVKVQIERAEAKIQKSVDRLEDAKARAAERLQEEMAEKNEKTRSAEKLQAGTMPSKLTINEDIVQRWFAALADEHPEIYEQGRLQLSTPFRDVAQRFFSDEVMVPLFGKPFDRFSIADMALLDVYLSGVGVSQLSVEAPSKSHVEVISGAKYVVPMGIDQLHHSVLARLLVVRRLKELNGELQTRTGSLKPESDTFERLDAWQSTVENLMGCLGPNDQSKTLVRIRDARQRHGDSVLVAIARKTVKDSLGPEAIPKLAAWWESLQAFHDYVSPDARDQAEALINERLDGLLSQVIEPFLAEVATFGEGREAVERGVEFYERFDAEFSFATDRPAVAELIVALRDRRKEDISVALSSLISEIEKEDSSEKVSGFVRRMLSVPGDAETPAGRKLVAAAVVRSREIDTEKFLAQFSDGEKAMMDQSGRIKVPVEYPAPTEEEVRMAFLREIVAFGGKRVDNHRSLISMPGLRMLKLFTEYEIKNLEIFEVKKIDNGYAVYSEMTARIAPVGDLKEIVSSDPLQAALYRGMQAGISEPTQNIHVFTLTPDGWRSPTVRASMVESVVKFCQAMGEALEAHARAYNFTLIRR